MAHAPPVGRALKALAREATLAQRVHDRLREAVVTGELQPGQRIIETDLAHRLGVSRAPLREALRRLERDGLVVTLPHRGTFIAELTEADLEEMYPVRTLLEGFAARLATARAADGTARELAGILDQMRQLQTETTGRHELVDLDFAFHQALVGAAGNRHLQALWQTFAMRIRLSIVTATPLYARPERLPQDVADSHQVIVEAVRRGDPEAAEAAVRRRAEALRQRVLSRRKPARSDPLGPRP
jgi:DNA-binding GntR family transcriptional regulator